MEKAISECDDEFFFKKWSNVTWKTSNWEEAQEKSYWTREQSSISSGLVDWSVGPSVCLFFFLQGPAV